MHFPVVFLWPAILLLPLLGDLIHVIVTLMSLTTVDLKSPFGHFLLISSGMRMKSILPSTQ